MYRFNNRKLRLTFQPYFWIVTFLIVLSLAGCDQTQKTTASANAVPTPVLTPTITPLPTTGMGQTVEEESWLRLPDMPADATQADIGTEIYRLVCSTCHGGQGQGLTEEWRATMDEETQNCWQAKCHASTHPPDGFLLPKYVPPVVGPHVSVRFETATDLFTFVSERMPYNAPGSLIESEYWQLTAFILDLNDYDLDNTVLNADTAATFKLR